MPKREYRVTITDTIEDGGSAVPSVEDVECTLDLEYGQDGVDITVEDITPDEERLATP